MHRTLQIILATLIFSFITVGFFGGWPEYLCFVGACLLTINLLVKWAYELNYMHRMLSALIYLIVLFMVTIGFGPLFLKTGFPAIELYYAAIALLVITFALGRIEWLLPCPSSSRHVL